MSKKTDRMEKELVTFDRWLTFATFFILGALIGLFLDVAGIL